jgi:hypothetical protein
MKSNRTAARRERREFRAEFNLPNGPSLSPTINRPRRLIFLTQAYRLAHSPQRSQSWHARPERPRAKLSVR